MATQLLPNVSKLLKLVNSPNTVKIVFPYDTKRVQNQFKQDSNNKKTSKNNNEIKLMQHPEFLNSIWKIPAILGLYAFSMLFPYIVAILLGGGIPENPLFESCVRLHSTGLSTFYMYLTLFLYYQHGETVPNLLNKMVEFEKCYSEDYKYHSLIKLKNLNRANTFFKLSCKFVIFSKTVTPASCLFAPEFPWNALPRECLRFVNLSLDDSLLFITVKISLNAVVFYANRIICMVLFNIAVIICCVNIFFPAFFFSAALNVFERKLRKMRSLARETLLFYRQLQLLCCAHNNISRNTLFPFWILSTSGFFTICTYIMVNQVQRYHNVNIITLISMFSNFMVILAMIVTFGCSSEVYILSKCILKRRLWINKNAFIEKRYWKSLYPIRINFFQSRFFDQATTLVILEQSVNNALTLILL